MSFQDVGVRKSGFGSAAAPRRRSSSSSSSSSAGTASSSSASRGGVDGTISQISDLLRQYQQNASLLERLGDTLQGAAAPSDELLRQVVAQQDVVSELAAASRRAISQLAKLTESLPRTDQPRPRAAHGKLNKDFERVSANVARVVEKLKASRRAALARGANNNTNNNTNNNSPFSAWSSDTGTAGRRGTASFSEGGGPHRVGEAQFGASDAPGDLDVVIGRQRVQLQVAMSDEAINAAILREREQEIREINQNVHKVNEIFRDLAGLVEQQQADVDQIGELVERSHAHAEKGLEQVNKASKLQPSCAIS